jgi:undecaprenyl-diphosphatase
MGKTEPDRVPISLSKAVSEIIEFLGWPLLFGFSLAGFGLLLFWSFTSEVFEGETIVFDERVRYLVQQFATPLLTRLMIIISFAGSPGFLCALGIPAAIVLLYMKWRRAFTLFAVTMAGSVLLNLILKAVFQRTRPEAFSDYELPASYSFPSGHALGAFCFVGILAWLVTARIKDPWLIWGLRLLSLFLVLCVGFSRIYLGVHYASDVIAGYLAAFVWIATVALGDSFLRRLKLTGDKKSPDPH